MPRCNLTLKQKCQIISLKDKLPTKDLAKKFHVHLSTISRIIKNQQQILNVATRINLNHKKTTSYDYELDGLVLEFIKTHQEESKSLSVKEICAKATEFSKTLGRQITCKGSWWRRFRQRCKIIKTRQSNNSRKNNSQSQHNNENSTNKKEPSSKECCTIFKIREERIPKSTIGRKKLAKDDKNESGSQDNINTMINDNVTIESELDSLPSSIDIVIPDTIDTSQLELITETVVTNEMSLQPPADDTTMTLVSNPILPIDIGDERIIISLPHPQESCENCFEK